MLASIREFYPAYVETKACGPDGPEPALDAALQRRGILRRNVQLCNFKEHFQ